jgi:hypothetical protein
MQALGFTPEDLQANQQGVLGINQMEHLRGLQTRTLLLGFAVFMLFTLLATTFLFLGQQNHTVILTLMGIFSTILNALAAGLFGRQWMRLSADLRGGAVESLDGTMERVVRTEGRMSNFVLRIAGEQFAVKKDLFRLFRHEIRYRIYRAPHSGTLLGAEPR